MIDQYRRPCRGLVCPFVFFQLSLWMLMAHRPKVLVVFENAVTLKELFAAAGEFELLPLRDRRQASAYVSASPGLVAVIVEQSAGSKSFLEVLQNLQAAHPTLRRVVLSDSSDVMGIIDGLHSGAIDAVAYRPIDVRQLHAAMLNNAPTTAAPASHAQAARRVVTPG
jgi:DNA-binding NarL/FixJ family response regulator